MIWLIILVAVVVVFLSVRAIVIRRKQDTLYEERGYHEDRLEFGPEGISTEHTETKIVFEQYMPTTKGERRRRWNHRRAGRQA